jgi:hypothetical protein
MSFNIPGKHVLSQWEEDVPKRTKHLCCMQANRCCLISWRTRSNEWCVSAQMENFLNISFCRLSMPSAHIDFAIGRPHRNRGVCFIIIWLLRANDDECATKIAVTASLISCLLDLPENNGWNSLWHAETKDGKDRVHCGWQGIRNRIIRYLPTHWSLLHILHIGWMLYLYLLMPNAIIPFIIDFISLPLNLITVVMIVLTFP